jgi:ABC-type Fe3+/spermidine/putrescine transport system ATPase subunit
MTLLKAENIHKVYEGQPLLTGVSLEVERGEIVSLLGPSGSGKTTLLRIIAGLESFEKGRVSLEGQDITRVPVHHRGVVLMFQEYALFPHRSVGENVAFGLRMQQLPRSEIEARVKEMLALVGLQEFRDRNVIELSGGERQRVALARSLAPEPRLLLLDEPLGSLDRTLRERLLEDLNAVLRRLRVTTIVVTHDQAEAFALADRVALLHETRVIQTGAPEEIYRYPATPWVARFLGLVNLFSAEVVGDRTVKAPFGTLTFDPGDFASGRLDSGMRGTLLVLPWGIRFVDDDARDNTYSATVSRRIFQGRTTKLELAIGRERLGVTLNMEDKMPHEGDRLRIRIAPSALRWFGRDAAPRPED